MKRLFVLITFLFAVHTAQSQSKGKIETATIKSEIFCDHCDKCGSCGGNIYNKIKSNKGIKSVDIDSETNSIIVKYNTKQVTLAEIEKAISEAGYKANDLQASAEGYEKLDNCCKKKAPTQ